MKRKNVLKVLLAWLLACIVNLLLVLALLWHFDMRRQDVSVVSDTVRVEVIDTIPYYKPVAKDSVVLRYVTRVLKVAQPTAGTVAERDTSLQGLYAQDPAQIMRDSAAVEIPITQKKYETDDYRAYVSGYEPSLDSIFLYRKTVTESVVMTRERVKKQRFGIGVTTGVGYGLITRKPDVYIGVGVYVRLW